MKKIISYASAETVNAPAPIITDEKKADYPAGYQALQTMPWREQFGTDQNAPVNKLDIILAQYAGRLKITDWKNFLKILSILVFPSIIAADKDGSLIPAPSIEPIDQLYKSRTAQLFNIIARGFLFGVLSAADLKQTRLISDALYEYATQHNLLPVLYGASVYTRGTAQLFYFNEQGELTEDTEYGKETLIPSEIIKIIDPILSGLVREFIPLIQEQKDLYGNYTGKEKDPYIDYRSSAEDCRQITIKPVPSFKLNPALFPSRGIIQIPGTNIEIEDRNDLRTQFFTKMVYKYSEAGVLEKLAVIQGGKTSIDTNLKGVDKGRGSNHLLGNHKKIPYFSYLENLLKQINNNIYSVFSNALSLANRHVAYLGDEFFSGGNDWVLVKVLEKTHINNLLTLYALHPDLPSIPVHADIIPLGYNEKFGDSLFNPYLTYTDLHIHKTLTTSKMPFVTMGKIIAAAYARMLPGKI
ncbi:MAG: hypothetical protein PHV30_05395 [Candidatus Margulisbacteria bacterium]|nr:hypothetical protein [Candidatus Margulisiibacteriota bacterium]